MEELKAILEAIQSTTGAAQHFGIFWLTNQLIKILLTFVVLGSLVLAAYKLLSNSMLIEREDRSNVDFVERVKELDIPDVSDYGSKFSDSEKMTILSVIDRGLKSIARDKTEG